MVVDPTLARPLRGIMMFGFRGGERPDTVARKEGYRQEAKDRWGFLTHYDLSTIKNEAQLSAMVQGRSGIRRTSKERRAHLDAGQAFLKRRDVLQNFK